MPFSKRAEDGIDDTEGNAARGKGLTDGIEDDDTEGNRFSSSDAEIKHDVTPVGNTEDEDDTEGNAAKIGRSVPPAANPGKGVRPKI